MSSTNYSVWTLKQKPGRFPRQGKQFQGVAIEPDVKIDTKRILEVMLDRCVDPGEIFTLADLEILFWKTFEDKRGSRPSRRSMARSLSFMGDWVEHSYAKKGRRDPVPSLMNHDDLMPPEQIIEVDVFAMLAEAFVQEVLDKHRGKIYLVLGGLLAGLVFWASTQG